MRCPLSALPTMTPMGWLAWTCQSWMTGATWEQMKVPVAKHVPGMGIAAQEQLTAGCSQVAATAGKGVMSLQALRPAVKVCWRQQRAEPTRLGPLSGPLAWALLPSAMAQRTG